MTSNLKMKDGPLKARVQSRSSHGSQRLQRTSSGAKAIVDDAGGATQSKISEKGSDMIGVTQNVQDAAQDFVAHAAAKTRDATKSFLKLVGTYPGSALLVGVGVGLFVFQISRSR